MVIVCVCGSGVGADGWGRCCRAAVQRWMLCVGLFACLCGVVAMLRLCCVVVLCMGVGGTVCVFGLWCGQSFQ